MTVTLPFTIVVKDRSVVIRLRSDSCFDCWTGVELRFRGAARAKWREYVNEGVRRTEIEHEKEEIYFDDRFCLWGKGQYAYKYVCAPAIVTFSLPLVCLLRDLSVRCMQSCGTTATHQKPLYYVFGPPAQAGCSDILILIIHSFYIVLFSALEQTHCAHWHVILNE